MVLLSDPNTRIGVPVICTSYVDQEKKNPNDSFAIIEYVDPVMPGVHVMYKLVLDFCFDLLVLHFSVASITSINRFQFYFMC